MKKLILNNLKGEKLNASELKEINGGWGGTCGGYYCAVTNPCAACCGGCVNPNCHQC